MTTCSECCTPEGIPCLKGVTVLVTAGHAAHKRYPACHAPTDYIQQASIFATVWHTTWCVQRGQHNMRQVGSGACSHMGSLHKVCSGELGPMQLLLGEPAAWAGSQHG